MPGTYQYGLPGWWRERRRDRDYYNLGFNNHRDMIDWELPLTERQAQELRWAYYHDRPRYHYLRRMYIN